MLDYIEENQTVAVRIKTEVFLGTIQKKGHKRIIVLENGIEIEEKQELWKNARLEDIDGNKYDLIFKNDLPEVSRNEQIKFINTVRRLQSKSFNNTISYVSHVDDIHHIAHVNFVFMKEPYVQKHEKNSLKFLNSTDQEEISEEYFDTSETFAKYKDRREKFSDVIETEKMIFLKQAVQVQKHALGTLKTGDILILNDVHSIAFHDDNGIFDMPKIFVDSKNVSSDYVIGNVKEIKDIDKFLVSTTFFDRDRFDELLYDSALREEPNEALIYTYKDGDSLYNVSLNQTGIFFKHMTYADYFDDDDLEEGLWFADDFSATSYQSYEGEYDVDTHCGYTKVTKEDIDEMLKKFGFENIDSLLNEMKEYNSDINEEQLNEFLQTKTEITSPAPKM